MMIQEPAAFPEFQFFHLFAVGQMEVEALPALFRELETTGKCKFIAGKKLTQVPVKDSQRPRVYGKDKTVPDRNESSLQLTTHKWSAADWTRNWIVVIDDLERINRDQADQLVQRWRAILDRALGTHRSRRAAFHLLVVMAEAYFFGDPERTNEVIGNTLTEKKRQQILGPGNADVEQINSPKSQLKRIFQDYKEREHGAQLLGRIRLETVLANPETCASLRSLVKWCVIALGDELTDQYQLLAGQTSLATDFQISSLQQYLQN